MSKHSGSKQSAVDMGKLCGLLKPISDRYDDISTEEDKFNCRMAIRSFVKCYAYITQLTRFHDEELFKEYVFCANLLKLLPKPGHKKPDIEDKIKLEYTSLKETFNGAIILDKKDVDLKPSGDKNKTKVPKKDTLQNIIDKINERFDGDFSEADRVIVESIYQMFMADKEVKKFKRYAKDTTPEMFVKSLFPDKFKEMAVQCYTENATSYKKLFSDSEFYQKVMESMAKELYRSLMDARANNVIVRDCSVIINHMKSLLEVWCDEGRIVTIFVNAKKAFELIEEGDASNPIAYIQPRQSFIDWINKKDDDGNIDIDNGIKQQYITLVCPTMAAHNCTIAETISDYYDKPWVYSHVALPLHTLSYVTCINPSMHLNAGVRASYASNHLKQAIGPTSRYSQLKYFNENNVLLSPEIPLVRTCAYDMIRLNEKPTGQNVTIAFLVYTDNQEDSFIINKSSVESGLLVIDSITSESSECSKQEEMFKIPSLENFLNGIPESYLKLNKQTCLPDSVGQKFYENEALIAKIAKLDKNKNVYADKSIVNNKPDGWREVNNPLCNGDKYHYLTSEMVTRELRCCTVDGVVGNNDKLKIGCFARRKIGIAGDKFNSMNAQKGTIGRIYDSTMMPYTANGLRPDIIFNPPSIFKRKTIGQIYEPTIGKLAALLGCPIESTPYTAMRTTAEMDKLFKELGLDEYGYEDMYDPDTGKLIGKAFIGVMHYQRQQHLVENKLNVRAGDGDIDRVTQIPIKGKRRGGGQAFDVMSCKCAFASGVTNVFQDIHANQGAKTIVAFCRWCNKQFTYFDNKKKVWVCSGCGQTQDFCIKEVIPAENLINNVLCGMHVCFEYQD
jgi:hypothetical protein